LENTLLPDTCSLTNHLSTLIKDGKVSSKSVEIISRKTSDYSSTFPTEIINCRINSNHSVTFFCKYLNNRASNYFGHRGGIEYEVEIYDKVLRSLPLSKAEFYGYNYLKDENKILLVLQYLEDSETLQKSTDPNILSKAASWLGYMHAFYQSKVPSFVKVYDASYYQSWGKLVEDLGNEVKLKYPWLRGLTSYFSENVNQLVSSELTLIHGEFYPKNVLLKDDLIYPVDWESAAKAPGQIDLASLIEGWPKEVVDNAVEAYKRARWGSIKNVPAEFDRILLLSQVYFNFRWMGEFIVAWMQRPEKFEQLYELAKRANCS
jgi:thiamine kinase-like enzyme